VIFGVFKFSLSSFLKSTITVLRMVSECDTNSTSMRRTNAYIWTLSMVQRTQIHCPRVRMTLTFILMVASNWSNPRIAHRMRVKTARCQEKIVMSIITSSQTHILVTPQLFRLTCQCLLSLFFKTPQLPYSLMHPSPQ